MPEFNKLAVQSWRVRNPNATIIILSNDNYKQYVSPDDLPSTFDELLPQHQSDMLRMAVLIRYGGIYMDVSTLLYRSLESIFDTMPSNTLGVVPMYSWKNEQDQERSLYNNYLLIATEPNTEALITWRERSRRYMEDPATSIEELDSKPLLRRIRPFMTCKEIGMFRAQAPYLCMCWLLTDLAWHEPDLNILELPFSDFGLGTPIIHEYTTQWKSLKHERCTRARRFRPAPSPSSQPLSYILGMGWTMFHHAHLYDRECALAIANSLTMIKISVHFHAFNRVEVPSTIDQLQRSTYDTKLLPTTQASLDRARMCRSIYGNCQV